MNEFDSIRINLEQVKREHLILRSICSWYMSQSIEKKNKMYYNCHIRCNGYDYQCGKYTPKYDLEALME